MPTVRAFAHWLPVRFWRLLGRGARLLRRHRLAARAYGVAAYVAPHGAAHHHDLGTALATLKRHHAAIRAFRHALLLDPQSGRSQRALGQMHRRLGQQADAARAFASAIQLLPNDAPLYHDLGDCLRHLGRHDGAAQAYSHAVRLRPGQVGGCRALGRALRACGRHEEAARALAAVSALQPNNAQAHFEEAREWYACGHYQQALAPLHKALALAPDHADSQLALRVCLQTESARHTWARLVGNADARVGCVVGGGIGNMVQCSPAIRHLAETLGRPVDVLLSEDSPGCAHLFRGAPWVATVFSQVADASAVPFDVLVVLDPFSLQLPPLNAGCIAAPRLTLPATAMQQLHEAEYHLKGLRETLGIAYQPEQAGAYFVGNYRRQPGVLRRIGLHAGCKGGRWQAKRWPYFQALAQRLMASGLEVVSFGGADEAVPGTLDLTGLPLNESIEAIAGCGYFISNDSGLMHIADALGVPLTSIFGPSSVTKNGPLAHSSQVVQLHKACAPCQFDKQRLTGCTCIGELSLEAVWNKLTQHLRSLPAFHDWREPILLVTLPEPRIKPTVQRGPYNAHAMQKLIAAHAWHPARTLLSRALSDAKTLDLSADAFEQLLHYVWVLAAQPLLTPHVARLVQGYPDSVLALCECAATVLPPNELDAVLVACAAPIFASNQPTPLQRWITACCQLASPAALVELLMLADASEHSASLHNPAVASQIGDALLGSTLSFHLAHSGLRDADFRRQAPVERQVEDALLRQDRRAFITHVNTCLAGDHGAEQVTRLLKNLTQNTAQLALAAGDIHYSRFDSHADNLLLAIHLNDHAMVEHSIQQRAPDAMANLLWRSRHHDYAPLNTTLARQLALAGAAPVRFEGADRLALFRSCLARAPLPDAVDRGLVSIILSVYAPETELLRVAVDSVLAQTYRNVELILVDDGNAPPGAALIASFAGPRVRILRSPDNIGVYACRNLGIAAAQGAFISFHDADDIAHPQRIELQLAALLNTPGCQLCYASHIRFDDGGGVQLEINPDRLNLLGDGPVTALLRRTTLEAIGPLAAVRTRGDIELRQRIQKCCGPEAVLQLDVPLLYCAGGAGTLSNRAVARHRHAIRLLRRAFTLRAWPPVKDGQLLSPPVGELAIGYGLRSTTGEA